MKTIFVEEVGGSREIDIYSDEGFALLSDLWSRSGWQFRSFHDVSWLGVPILQLPQDMVMMQELIWKTRPDVIVETGVHLGGSAVFYASMLELIGNGQVVSIDLTIPRTTRATLAAHPMGRRITLIEGSSVDESVAAQVRALIDPQARVLVALDSDHSRAHVRRELEVYAPLVKTAGYVVVFDGNMELLADAPGGRPEWLTDNPATAMREFLAEHPDFESDGYMNRLGATHCPAGFLRRKGQGTSEVVHGGAERFDEAVGAFRTEQRRVRSALEASVAEERRRHRDAVAGLQAVEKRSKNSEAKLKEEVRVLRAELKSVYRSRTWRAGRTLALMGRPLLRLGGRSPSAR